MTNFEKRLSKAVERGLNRSALRADEQKRQVLNEEQIRNLHTKLRLQLSEHIEKCIQQLPQHFPGFRTETIYGDRGWGAACSRDDVGPGTERKRANFYSRLELTVRPYSELRVLELNAKGTIRNKELFNRRHFELVHEADIETFNELIDLWTLEYAEQFAAAT